MIELKIGESVSLTNGAQAKIVKELGRGGQGIVYLVEVNGQNDIYNHHKYILHRHCLY